MQCTGLRRVPSHAGAQDGMTEVVLLSIGSGLNLLLLMEAPQKCVAITWGIQVGLHMRAPVSQDLLSDSPLRKQARGGVSIIVYRSRGKRRELRELKM